jgi:hypothetical protein
LIRIGLLGTNTSHAGVFAGIFNGGAGRGAALTGGQVTRVWGEPATRALADAPRVIPGTVRTFRRSVARAVPPASQTDRMRHVILSGAKHP